MNKNYWKLTLIAIMTGLLSGCEKGQATHKISDAADPIEVSSAITAQQELRRNVDSVGTLFPDEEVVISSQVDAECSKVLADVGDRVSEGQVLVQLSPTELQLAAAQQKA